jgi:hypothetical protein
MLGPILVQLGPDFGPSGLRAPEGWSAILEMLQRVTAVRGYVNNHFAGRSPRSSREVQRLLRQQLVPPHQLGEQTTLF